MDKKLEQLPEDSVELLENIADAMIKKEQEKTVVSKKEIISKLKELGYNATEKNVITSPLEKGYVLIIDPKSEDRLIKIKAAELGFENYTMYRGYGYHGGGRPRKDAEARRMTISISGTPSEIEQLKQLANASGKTVSRYILDSLKN